ncbi:hypothetical protein ABVR20_001824 [Escherichia coli]
MLVCQVVFLAYVHHGLSQRCHLRLCGGLVGVKYGYRLFVVVGCDSQVIKRLRCRLCISFTALQAAPE